MKREKLSWHEILIFSSAMSMFAIFLMASIIPAWLNWGNSTLDLLLVEPAYTNTFLANTAGSIFVYLSFQTYRKFPSSQSLGYSFPIPFITWLLLTSIFIITREEYSRPALMSGFIGAELWILTELFISKKLLTTHIGVVPFGKTWELKDTKNYDDKFSTLHSPILLDKKYDAIVADLHAQDIPPQWQRFLAQCTLSRVPVFHINQLLEFLTGKVKIDHLYENELGILLPSRTYEVIKHTIDISLVLIMSPIWLPALLFTGVLIKIESKGPALFAQERIGRGGKPFTLYKLRSMHIDSEREGSKFAEMNDARVTRVGKLIRKVRIDEIPQFINIILGDMSLIGPRPEQRKFVEKYEEELPFYTYRHVIRPGITGWAQVELGYTSNTDDTRIKIQHDFYYIKHYSFWLDFLIILKTIKTIFTGFGAR